MSTYIQDTKAWLEKWDNKVEEYCKEPSLNGQGGLMKASLEQYGIFLQSEAILLEKLVGARRRQCLISKEEELIACKQLVRAALALRPGILPAKLPPIFLFPQTWTHAHMIFTAIITLCPETRNNAARDTDIEEFIPAGLELLRSKGLSNTAGLADSVEYLL